MSITNSSDYNRKRDDGLPYDVCIPTAGNGVKHISNAVSIDESGYEDATGFYISKGIIEKAADLSGRTLPKGVKIADQYFGEELDMTNTDISALCIDDVKLDEIILDGAKIDALIVDRPENYDWSTDSETEIGGFKIGIDDFDVPENQADHYTEPIGLEEEKELFGVSVGYNIPYVTDTRYVGAD